MALRYLLDENVPGALSLAIVRHNATSGEPLQAQRVEISSTCHAAPAIRRSCGGRSARVMS